ncbi:lycopene cyclase domain-containing protein [candidate division KSB1 bacterium]|nr:lycopene cyclase domain-containing protein [candidate division KSB1 bacterium]
MKSEYLLFNIVIMIGPILSSFDRKVYFYQHWRHAVTASVLVMIPYIVWDFLVTGNHWWFNRDYTLDVRFLHLPLGEWLFFISIPFACLFVWQIMDIKPGGKTCRICYLVVFILIPISVILMTTGKQYTALVVLAASVTVILDFMLKTKILFQRKTLYYFGIVTAFILAFNGYLTARPVVLYNPKVQLGFRIFTIPVEDFLYGYGHIFLCIIVYQGLKKIAKKR